MDVNNLVEAASSAGPSSRRRPAVRSGCSINPRTQILGHAIVYEGLLYTTRVPIALAEQMAEMLR